MYTSANDEVFGASSIFVTTGPNGGSVLFQERALFCTENAGFWPILANLGYFVANLRTLWCTFKGLHNAVASQN